MKKILFAAIFLVVTAFILPVNFANAAPKKVQKQHIQQAKVHTQYFKKQNLVNLWFTGLRDVKTVEYTLSYKSNGVVQGVSGTIEDNHSQIFRKIQLATCSANTCLNHKHITDLKLEVTITYKNGRVVTKTYDLGRRWDRDRDKKCDWE